MPGIRITSNQAEIYMSNRNNGKTQAMAAAKAGFTARSGHDIEHNKRPKKQEPRQWKTRVDPFSEVWESEVVPMLKQGIYEATFVLNELQKKYLNKFSDSHLRSLQRKLKKWKALFGKEQEVMFRQLHEPGKLGISDFTHLRDVAITLNGVPFEHILYHFRLPYSGFNYVQVFAGSGEPYTAFACGLQNALQVLGGVPEIHRTDSLSASFKNLNKDAKEDLTERYKVFAEHYGMQATRINPGKPNENGAIESSHHHVKNRIEQSLIIRDSYNFSSVEEYQTFLEGVIKEHNKRSAGKIEIERAHLRPLPAHKAVDYDDLTATVNCTSTIIIKRVMYSVPSRLIGERLRIRMYHDKLECYVGNTFAIALERVPNPPRGKRMRKINYRHVVHSLVKKPGAFRYSWLRDELLCTDNLRSIWNHVDKNMSHSNASKFMVGVLHLAAMYDCEELLTQMIIEDIAMGKVLRLTELQNKFTPSQSAVPTGTVTQHDLNGYNQLIPNYGAQ